MFCKLYEVKIQNNILAENNINVEQYGLNDLVYMKYAPVTSVYE